MKILVATDGSKFSQRAVEQCCRMFDGSDNTQIRIISAAAPVIPGTEPFGLSAEYYNDLQRAAEAQAQQAIEKAETRIRLHPGLGVGITSRVIKGNPQQSIVEEAERWGADVIVVGSHGYGFWQRALLGSVSDSVIRHANCSVLIVREEDAH